MTAAVRAVLFDLDGTLIDSAPDLAGAGNDMRAARGLPMLPLAHFRPMVGSGARGMLGRALQVQPGHPDFEALRDEFLQRYEARMTRETQVFAAMRPVLAALRDAGRPWGIVTNKATRFSEPLVRALGLLGEAATLICGDTTPHSKPHPAPLLEAARRLGVAPAECVYVGDDLRDVQAGRAAGMLTVAAAWGYLGEGEAIADWDAHHVVESPGELLKLLALP
ncbi:MAG: phosphoglycolate phosphatase [Piscinibacter sp.]|uniref:phosphoglycolate phosphatase n=1 Tax=Piscinibacter sp. TaxID=1903157 RepID=UPI001B5C46DA|nr:phosphoglycolate phosphatase [Piscinibacter sp.]MBP5989064.1 phosphoglycolate phosphatase [Piscinibacter sp.]MBP6026216.1 phosphoglycolate phosphatase [Piscinibacter sp.]